MQDTVKKIIEIITADFPNGLRDDFIDTNKILRIYAANHSDENISRDFVVDVIHKHGIFDGTRFYFFSENIRENVKQFIDKIFSTCSIAYYGTIYEKHSGFFARFNIFSPEVFKKILRETDGEFFYFDEFCIKNRTIRLDYEISKIFMAAEKSLSIADLQKKLKYVPAEKISEILGNEKKYLPTITDKYVSVSKIQLDFEEIQAAEHQIYLRIKADGYATFDDFSLDSNFALNPELGEKVLSKLIYEKFFSDDFTKRGKKFFKKYAVIEEKNSKRLIDTLREFVVEKDEVTVDELFDCARKFRPDAYGIALNAAFERMIRVDKNLFVKDSLIKFDVKGIDNALTPFVQGKIIPIRAVTSFTGFPPAEGYTWNLFLLESFLRKYSRKYVYHTAVANSANVGAIYPESMNFEDYLEVQAAVVVQEKIPLNKSSVENFLVNRGFRIKRIASTTNRIISAAEDILRMKVF